MGTYPGMDKLRKQPQMLMCVVMRTNYILFLQTAILLQQNIEGIKDWMVIGPSFGASSAPNLDPGPACGWYSKRCTHES